MDEIGEASLKDEIKKITTQISRNTTNKNKYDKEFLNIRLMWKINSRSENVEY